MGPPGILFASLASTIVLYPLPITAHRPRRAPFRSLADNLESNFAAGGTDGQYRLRANVNVSATDLIQTYFPAFDAAVKEAEVRSVMCSCECAA